nr:hypothetical protein Q903MT_gene4587 [Picea sitchensis]
MKSYPWGLCPFLSIPPGPERKHSYIIGFPALQSRRLSSIPISMAFQHSNLVSFTDMNDQ